MKVYYNENDPEAAEWLRQLIDMGQLPQGEVDERSIVDVAPDDLEGFDQCHFFAGIGALALAVQHAGYGEVRGLWTGSCPCQGFSNTGKRGGFDDPRHLWPNWFPLIRAHRPQFIFGEQVGAPLAIGKVGRKAGSTPAPEDEWAWLDLVQNDLEDAHYTVGHSVFPACSVGAPHIRSRLYFMAHSDDARPQRRHVRGNRTLERATGTGGVACGLVNADGSITQLPAGRWPEPDDAQGTGPDSQSYRPVPFGNGRDALHTFWSDADWLWCRDERWRPVEPSLEPLVTGFNPRMGPSGDPSLSYSAATSEGRVMRLRGYGNSVVVEQATIFIEAGMEVI